MADPTTTNITDPSQTATTVPNLPRFIQQAGDQTVYDTSGGYLDPITSPADFLSRSGSSDIAGNTTVVPNAQSALTNYFNQRAQATYAPQEQQALNQIDLSGQQLNQNEAQTKNDFANAQQQMLEGQNNLGLLSSGGTAALNAKNATDKASALASIALQRAGLANQAAQVKTTAQQSINDMVNKLISGSTQAQQNAVDTQMKIAALAQTIPVGQTVTIGGKTITGTMQPKLTYQDLGNKVVALNDQGQVVQSFAKGLTPSASAGSGFGTTAFNPAKATPNDLSAAIQQAMSSGQYSANGAPNTQTREALIQQLGSLFAGSKFKPADIATAVYSQFRGQNEPLFTGLTSQQVDNFNNPAAAVKASEADQKTNQTANTLFNIFNKVNQASQAINTNPANIYGFSTGGYLQGNTKSLLQDPNANTLNSAGGDLGSLSANLLDTKRFNSTEIQKLTQEYIPKPTDSTQVAQTKIANFAQLIGSKFPDQLIQYSQQNPIQFPSEAAVNAAKLPAGTHVTINGRPAVITP